MRSLKLKRSLVLVVPVVLAGGLVAGCDGDSTELSETDYRVATGKVCEKYQKVIEADVKKIQTAGSGSQIWQNPEPFIEVVEQFQDDWGQFVSAIKAVDPPPDAQKQIDKFTAALTESEAELDDMARIVDQLPGLKEDVKSFRESPNTADAQAFLKKANKAQADIQKRYSGFQTAANRANAVIDSYPGLSQCR